MASCQGEQCCLHQLSFQVKGKKHKICSHKQLQFAICVLILQLSAANQVVQSQECIFRKAFTGAPAQPKNLSKTKKLKLLQNSNLVTGRDNQHWLLLRPSHMNCFKNSVATSRPRVFTDSFNSLISLSISWSSCKQNDVSADMCANIQCLHIST